MREPLFKIDPLGAVEVQVDAMFAPAYSLIPEQHHKLIEHLEREMIHALKSAMRLPSTEPISPDPDRQNGWVEGSVERLSCFLTPKQRSEWRKQTQAKKSGK
jgi:hypothetical protein